MDMREQPRQPKRILRFPQVKARIPLSRPSIWRLERDGKFPKRLQISANAVGWLESEIDAWISARKSR